MFGPRKGFPRVEQLADIVEHGAPVHVEGSKDCSLLPNLDALTAPQSDEMV